jgi:methionyl-tRNA formyltransferase
VIYRKRVERMKKIKIAYAGGRSLGVKTLQWLSGEKRFEVVAVCPVPYENDPEYHDDFMRIIQENEYRNCDIADLKNIEIDLGLSVNYHKIIKEDILCHCSMGFYNIHHSYNLRLRGRNITTHAILNTLDENVFYHGTSLHRMVPKLDAGPIVASSAVNIEECDTAYSLFNKADKAAYELIKEWLPRISEQCVFPYYPASEGIHMYRNADLPDRRIDSETMSSLEINTYVRAFDFPGKEPAFIEKSGKKKHLVCFVRDQYQHEIMVKGHTYFTD